ncbi:Disintegrin and metalloproteinase domain-containing protein B-like protein [Emericellopsis cladophorae]|uniref:Disintegrin and metalloproteinase domain-containing protein B n=1 Tax=Emericellopsis cladophorae TaxID=2686198 RepID=A0A9P9Y1L8_9HYPO|nr:Disintegrin and metalloproteinase domain-containing protein B-like protein [Emericellopsis cladophorae]KAI6781842.1 Disintegrin and metalloproteinase domain-containing protein B-like protein [Emericellopsis cladophorae]
MISFRSVATAVLAGAAIFSSSTTAHSTKRNAVSAVSIVTQPVIDTPAHRVHAHSEFDIVFDLRQDGLDPVPIRLALEPNHDILHDDLTITSLDPDGTVREVERVDRKSRKVFKGRAYAQKPTGWTQAGWARIIVHRDGKKPLFEGAFRVFGVSHHIQQDSKYRKVKHEEDPEVPASQDGEALMVVYRDSDIRPSELKRDSLASTCDSDNLGFNTRYDLERRQLEQESPNLAMMPAKSLFGRQIDNVGDDMGANYYPTIGSTSGCPDTRQVALVGIATDCSYWDEFDRDRDEVEKNVIDLVNRASALYEDTFSISLAIRNLTVIDRPCSQSESGSAPWNLACSNSVTLGDRLNLFSGWRGQNLDSNAYWTLLTTCSTDTAVGLAWRGQLCRSGSSEGVDDQGGNETVAATNVVVRTAQEWQIFAHETGHTFGAVHDCTSEVCPVSRDSQSCCPFSSSTCDAGGSFIMNPSTNEQIDDFSPCSIGNICSGLLRNVNGECLTNNRNVGTFTGSQCGNGIVEEGEDCDCGGTEGCGENSCCNGETCEFRDGAVCDPVNEGCCTDECAFKSSGTVCRASTGDCDPEETCSGDSGLCPSNEHLNDGDSCGDGLECASGQCTSRDMQCRAVVGGGNLGNDNIEACGGTDSCILTCRGASDSSVCSMYNTYLLDGTSCSGDGHCKNGSCEGASVWGRIQEWFRNNKNIAIPVCCVVGGLLLLCIACCIYSSCRRCQRRRTRKRAMAKRPPPPPPEMAGGNSTPPVGGYWQPENRNDRFPSNHHDPTSQPFNPNHYGTHDGHIYEDNTNSPLQNRQMSHDNNYEMGRWQRTGSTRYA